MKKTFIWIICFLFLLTGCSSNVLLENNFNADDLTEEIAKYIVLSYNSSVSTADTISDGKKVPYENAFLYFSYSGFYMQNGQLREEVKPYLNGDIYCLPAQMVDTYLLSKFDTQVDHNVISVYDEQSKTYTIRPAKTYLGKITEVSVTALGEKKYQIVATITDEVSLRLLLQTFTVQYDGDYRFLSFQQKEPLQELSTEEQLLVSFVEDYYCFNPHLTFNSENKLTYDQIFPFFSLFGFWDENGNLCKNFDAYAIGGLYDPYQIPASIVDGYLLSKFDVAVDHTLIDCYVAQKKHYTITPVVSDWYNVIQLIDYEKNGNIYTVSVKQFDWSNSKNEQVQKFCLEIENNNCKYLSVT